MCVIKTVSALHLYWMCAYSESVTALICCYGVIIGNCLGLCNWSVIVIHGSVFLILSDFWTQSTKIITEYTTCEFFIVCVYWFHSYMWWITNSSKWWCYLFNLLHWYIHMYNCCRYYITRAYIIMQEASLRSLTYVYLAMYEQPSRMLRSHAGASSKGGSFYT